MAISALGIRQIIASPKILNAFNPYWALKFITHSHLKDILLVMGLVMLAVTGGEALFADMGHFGKRPIRAGWFSVVYPALIMSYLGQGAYLISGSPL